MAQQVNRLTTKPDEQSSIPGKWKETGLEKNRTVPLLLFTDYQADQRVAMLFFFTFLAKHYLNIFLSGPMIFNY